MSSEEKFDLSRADPAVVEIALSDAREQIQALYGAALAADQRALLLGSIQVALALAALGAGSSALSGDWAGNALPWGMLLAGLLLVVAAGFALWTARPVNMPFPGNQLASWREDLAQGLSLTEVRAEHLAVHQRTINRMDRVLRSNGKTAKISLLLSFAAPVVVLQAAIIDAVCTTIARSF